MAIISDEENLTHLRAKANQAEQTLIDAVFTACPGEHKPVQRRDRLPAWCSTCGRTRRGVRVAPAQIPKNV